MIAEGFARLARDDRFKSNPLSVVRALVDHNLALGVSLRHLIGEYAKQRPIQARERRVVEMAFDNGAGVGELTIAMCRGLVELTATAHGTIAVVVGMAHEFPLVRHFGNLPRSSLRFGTEYEHSSALGRQRSFSPILIQCSLNLLVNVALDRPQVVFDRSPGDFNLTGQR